MQIKNKKFILNLSTYYRKVAEKATGTGHVTTTTPIPTTIPSNGECCDGAAWVPECGMPGLFSYLDSQFRLTIA